MDSQPQRQMKIVCVSASQVPSDTANSIQVMKACQGMAQLGHQVTLLLPGSEPYPWALLASHYGLRTRFAIEWLPARPRLRRYDLAYTASRRARVLQADLLYIWPLQAAVAGLLSGLPVALELHGPPEGRFGPSLFRLMLALPGHRRLLPITRALADLLRAAYPNAARRAAIVMAPNGVDLERYQNLPAPEAARREIGLPPGATAGYTGHLYPGRGMALLMELARRLPELRFLWVGGRQDDVARWQAKLRQEGLTNVVLTGFVPNEKLPRYQAAAEVLLMPYERYIEGSSGGNSADYCSPMKMFEYLASARAIVSSDLPVLREVLSEASAVFCEPDDPDAWTGALAELFADPGRQARLAMAARDRAENFSWSVRAARCLDGFPPR